MLRRASHPAVAALASAALVGTTLFVASSAVADSPDSYLEIKTRNGSGGALSPGSFNKAVSLFENGELTDPQQFWASSNPWTLGSKSEQVDPDSGRYTVEADDTLLVQPVAGEPGTDDNGHPVGCVPFTESTDTADASTAVYVSNGLAVRSTRTQFDEEPKIPLSSPFRGQIANNITEKNRLAKNIGTYECLQLGLGPDLDDQLMTQVSFTARQNPRWANYGFPATVRVEAFLGETQQACESKSLTGTKTLSFFNDADVVFDTLVFGSGSCDAPLPGIRTGEGNEINDESGAGYNIALNAGNDSVDPLTIELTPALTTSGSIAPGDEVSFDTSDQGVNVQSQVDFPADQPDLSETPAEPCNVDDTNLIGYSLSHANISGSGPTLDYVFEAEWIVPAPDDVLVSGDPPTLVGNCLFEWTTTMLGTGDLTPLIDYDGDETNFDPEPIPLCVPLTTSAGNPLAYETTDLSGVSTTTVERPLTETEASGKDGLSCIVESRAGSFDDGDGGLLPGKEVKILIWNDPNRFG